MKIAVFGGTGQVGSRVVAEAAGRGHEVTVLSRHEAAGASADGRWQQADVTDPALVAAVAAEHDAVVFSVAPGRDSAQFPGLVRRLADAVGGTRLLVVGGAGSLLAAPGVRLVDLAEFPEAYRTEALAQAEALEVLRAAPADVDWTYLSPAPELVPGERTGAYLVGTDEPAGSAISYEDFAVALVDELERPKHQRTRFTVAQPA
jgi:uncharacterized protein